MKKYGCKNKFIGYKTFFFKTEIDRLVYGVYGLPEEEIRVIEKKTEIKK